MRRESVRRSERGASAVEFALVAPLLSVALRHRSTTGFYFADVVTVQQGLGDAARTAVTAPASASGPQWGGSTCQLQQDSERAATSCSASRAPCSTASIRSPASSTCGRNSSTRTGHATADLAPGNRLRLCTVTDHPPVLPVVPLPAGGRIETRVDMPVQAVPAQVQMASAQTPLPSGDWSWC